MTEDELDALIMLAHLGEPGDQVLGSYVRKRGPVAAVQAIKARKSGLRDGAGLYARLRLADPAAAREKCGRIGAQIITRGTVDWPTQLDDLGDAAPFALWVQGVAGLRLAALRSLAVVGARASTSYGEAVCRDWCATFADTGWTVASGGAYGIDAAAHRGTLSASGVTVCVLAGGVDVAYPKAHEALIARIADEGVVVSESPPGEGVRRHRFLSRNRIIAALTRATVVIEASVRSGTTSTANAAMQLNRYVLAVPGPVTSPMSAGCHNLIREQGAILASCPEDVLEVLGPLSASIPRVGSDPQLWEVPHKVTDDLSAREMRVLDAFPGRGEVSLNQLVCDAGLGPMDVAAALGILDTGGFVKPNGMSWTRAGRA
ncbi:putative DNA processing protein DprA [Actinomycetes bacterium]|nr:putative DNA processing protein DprA [Actinomycetes bacterium]